MRRGNKKGRRTIDRIEISAGRSFPIVLDLANGIFCCLINMARFEGPSLIEVREKALAHLENLKDFKLDWKPVIALQSTLDKNSERELNDFDLRFSFEREFRAEKNGEKWTADWGPGDKPLRDSKRPVHGSWRSEATIPYKPLIWECLQRVQKAVGSLALEICEHVDAADRRPGHFEKFLLGMVEATLSKFEEQLPVEVRKS